MEFVYPQGVWSTLPLGVWLSLLKIYNGCELIIFILPVDESGLLSALCRVMGKLGSDNIGQPDILE